MAVSQIYDLEIVMDSAQYREVLGKLSGHWLYKLMHVYIFEPILLGKVAEIIIKSIDYIGVPLCENKLTETCYIYSQTYPFPRP